MGYDMRSRTIRRGRTYAIVGMAGAVVAGGVHRTELQARPAVRAVFMAKRRRRHVKVHRARVRRRPPATHPTRRVRYVYAASVHTSAAASRVKVSRPKATPHHAKTRRLLRPARRRARPRRRAKALGVHAKRKKRKKRAASSPGMRHYAVLFGGALLSVFALYLMYSSVRRRPGARATARARARARIRSSTLTTE